MFQKKMIMMKKLNSKGQGALEYLLIIGGVVLVAVVVVALLIGMSSENTENSKQQSKEFIASTDVALPSTILSVVCKEKAGNDEYVVKWNATHKEGYEYTVLFDDKPIIFLPDHSGFELTPADNPIVFTIADYDTSQGSNPIVSECSSIGSQTISIKTTNTENDTTSVSNRVFIKSQQLVGSSLAFNLEANNLTIGLYPDITVGGSYQFVVYANNVPRQTEGVEFNTIVDQFDSPYNLSCSEYGLNKLCDFLREANDNEQIVNKIEIIDLDQSNAVISTIINVGIIAPPK